MKEMEDVILRVENLSKQYRLGLLGTGSISHDFNRWWHIIRGKEDPYLKIGEVNDRSKKSESPYVWALKDISFDIKKGEVVGIIGKNGAGKSTLLKILSKVTGPSTGSIKSRGRIASLLEVGTGFHPEMTGKENIFLNGAILGMTKKEIASKLDEIIDFSGCGRYIDTPVKRYSSGMRVRLAFAVAAFLEPDILIVDEVLAVGDAEFQKKALGKMQDISNTGGRTILFVSHDMVAIKQICERVIILENGTVKSDGKPSEMILNYLSSNSIGYENPIDRKVDPTHFPFIKRCSILDQNNQINHRFNGGEEIILSVDILNDITIKNNYSLLWVLKDSNEAHVAASSSGMVSKVFYNEQTKNIKCKINTTALIPGDYTFKLVLHIPKEEPFDVWDKVIKFEIVYHDINNVGYNYSSNWDPKIYLSHKWLKE